MLEFEVNNQIIVRKDEFSVVADSKNYLKAHFKLSAEWQGDVIALFGYERRVFQVLLDENNSCSVPFEVIKTPSFSVSLACGTEELVTANVLNVNVEASGFAEGEEPLEPTPDLWQQYIAKMQDNIENALPYIGDNGHWFLYNAEIEDYEDTGILARGTQGEKGDGGQNGHTPVKGEDYWTPEDIAEIRSYIDLQLGVIENGSY